MTEIVDIIVNYVSIWAPALVAILGILATVAKGLGELRKAVVALKEDKTISDLNKKIDAVVSENKELVRCNKLLLDRLTAIKNYSEEVNKP